jgi:hypothetical protein
MNMSELQDLIAYYKENLTEEHIQVDIMFVKKTTGTNHLYNTWMLECRNQDIEEMLGVTLENMEKITQERTIDMYDFELSTDDTVQVIEEEKVSNYKQLTEAITIEYTDCNNIDEKTEFDKLDFVVVKISDNSEKKPAVTLLKKYLKSPAKFKGTKRFVFNGSEAVAFDKPLLVIGSNVEAFNVAGYFYIINRDNFNTILNFKDMYYKIVDDNAEQIRQAELFDNVDDFIDDCRNNGRYVVRLTKAILVESFKNVKNNKNKLQGIKKNYGLKLEFTDDGKIVYNKEHVNEILNLLLEHYVTSALTDKRMLAKAIEKYE